MKLNKQIGAGLSVWIVLAWGLTSFLGLNHRQLFALRLILTVFGGFIAGAIAWYKKRSEAANVAAIRSASGDAAPASDLASILLEADRKLSGARQTGEHKLRTGPVIFLTGPPGSMKTTAILQSGLEPELLAGQVHQDGQVASTNIANVWLARQTAFVEAGHQLQTDIGGWQRLAKYVQPGKLKAAFSRAHGASRAAVVCYECENLLQAGASEAVLAAARNIRAQLTLLSTTLGANVPVYVLFTKLDRIAFFPDYVRNMDNAEASQVVGVALPAKETKTGVYGELESARLGAAFGELVASLSIKRTELLSRESDPQVALSAYEFPREFRKLRAQLVNFLLELCRPSQLSAGPFLRGFYFCGVRPVVLQEEVAAEAPRLARARQEAFNPEATAMFSFASPAALQTSASPRVVTRKVPQWMFLAHFFSDVVLGDRSGLEASGASAKTNVLRRLLLASAIALCLLFGAVTLLSFFENRALVDQVRESASAVAADSAASGNTASLESLAKLDALRQSLLRLTNYGRTQPPLSMRWGLYTGAAILPATRGLYFDRYKLLLFGSIQSDLLSTMRSWPPSPLSNDEYGYDYNTLKAYLETTSHHEKATLQYLPALLQERWTGNKTVDPQRLALARRQFDFYTSELVQSNPYSSVSDAATVESARRFLAQFAGVARVYQAMLTEANQNNKPVVFNQRFPGSSQVVINTREVPGGFTKSGFAYMENALKNPDKYVSGEQWVLGDRGAAVADTPGLASQIRSLYYTDYANAWRDYLKKTVIVRYANLNDAARKLTLTSSPESPLLALFWLAAQNTSVNAPTISDAFKPLHALMPGNADQYIGPSNTNYMTALTALQNSLDQASKMPPEQSQAAADQTASAASTARLATRETALTLGLDPQAHIEKTIEQLMEEPITYAEAVKPEGPSPAPLNAAGAAFCSQYRRLMRKYPFDSNATAQATLDDLNAIFKPQSGALWQFYDGKLSKLLLKQGGVYAPANSEKPALTSHFVNFFNNAAGFSNALYANGTAQDPKLTFALQPAFSTDLQSVRLTIDGQSADFASNSPAHQFTWPGAGGVRLTAKSGSDFVYPNYDGLWGIFEFFSDADKPVPSPEWMLKSGKRDKPVTSPVTNQPIVVQFQVDMLGGPPVFQKGYFAQLACVAEVAK